MLPRWHILFGFLFTIVLWIVAPTTPILYLVLFFLASFLIDFDHYMNAAYKTGKLGLFSSFEYHKKLGKIELSERDRKLKRKGDFHLFHTIEFHVLVALLGFLWTGFFYIFLGMLFHTLIDVFSMMNRGVLYRREYFFFNWLRKQF